MPSLSPPSVGIFRPFSKAALPCLVCLPLIGSTLAAPITWETPKAVSDATDVSVEGAYFGSWAPYNAGANTTPVNGVTFEGFGTLGSTQTGLDGGGNYFGPVSTPDANYNGLLGYAAYSNGTVATITLNGTGTRPLTVGRQYLVQFWVVDARNLGATPRSETISGSADLLYPADGTGMGSYVIGRFTADDVTQLLELTANVSAQINLIQVRDVTPVATGQAFFNGASGNIWDSATTAVWASAAAGPYNKTWTATGGGTAVFQGTAANVTVNGSVDASGLTFSTSGYELSGDGTVNLSGAGIASAGAGTATISAAVGGLGGINKQGTGTLILSGLNTYNGPTALTAGVLELHRDEDADYPTNTTFSGPGTLRKTGPGAVVWGPVKAVFAMDAAGLIDIEEGTFSGGSHGNEDWTANQAGLKVAEGAVFKGVEGNIRVNALTGSGEIRSGYNGAGYTSFTFGAGNGGGTFDGILTDDAFAGNFVKEGTGTQVLNGINTYTGSTTVNGGVLSLTNPCFADTSSITIAAGAVLNLNYTGTDDVSTLFLDATPAATGRWGRIGSVAAGTADHETAFITGNGVLNVALGTVPETPAYFSGAAATTWDLSATTAWSTVSGGPYNKKWNATGAGFAVFQGTAASVSLDSAIPVNGLTFTTSGYVIGGGGTLNLNGGGIVDTGAGDATIEALVGGTALEKRGAGTLTLSGKNTWSGPALLSAGTLELRRDEETDFAGAPVFSGTGTLKKTGAGSVYWGPSKATFAFEAGSLIDVEEGTFTGGSYANDDWTANQSDLQVAAGAVFKGVEANIRVNALKGEGDIRSGYPGAGYTAFTFGAGDGDGTFDGTLADDAAPGNFVKTGGGTQVLNGFNTYTGSTTVESGVLTLSTASLADGSTISIKSSGVLNLTHMETDTVGKIILEDVEASSGRWGAMGSVAAGKADFETPLITGTGILSTGTLIAGAYGDWAALHITGVNPSADATTSGDPDGDGQTNLAEFALNGDPLSGAANPRVVVAVKTVGGVPVLTLTLPVRGGAAFSAPGAPANGELVSGTVDGIVYHIQGTIHDLSAWTLGVTEVTGADATAAQSGLPAPDDGWTYRTFRAPGTITTSATGFLRAKIATP